MQNPTPGSSFFLPRKLSKFNTLHRDAYVGGQKSDFGLLGGGNTVHKGILEFVLYYIRFDLKGPPSSPRMTVSDPYLALSTTFLCDL